MTRRRLARRLLGLVLLLLLLELALQLASPLVQGVMARDPEAASPEAALTVLCVGDSNTFGLHLERVYAYPALLQAALNMRYRRPVTVANRGIPGQNTAQIAHGLLADLPDVDPGIVLILGGINDTWNPARAGGTWSWLGRLKLVRLTRVLAAGVTTAGRFEIRTDEQDRIVVDRGDGGRPVNTGPSEGAARLPTDLAGSVLAGLTAAVEACRDWGARPVLMTYPESHGDYTLVNRATRDLARAEDLLLVDHEAAFEVHFAQRGYETLMYPDHHPNLAGYRLMVSGILDTLEGAALVPPTPEPGAAAPVARPRAPYAPSLARGPAGTLTLRGPPGWAWRLLVGGVSAPGDGFDAGGVLIPLANDQVLALSRQAPGLEGRFPATGEARVTIPATLRNAAEGPLAACLVLLHEALWVEDGLPTPPAVAAASAALRVQD